MNEKKKLQKKSWSNKKVVFVTIAIVALVIIVWSSFLLFFALRYSCSPG